MTHATYQPEERMRAYRVLTDKSIQLARDSQWEEAAQVNRDLLASFPRDLSALNRLGKALSELGRYGEAKRAYNDALELDPTNNIARKNLDRLSQLSDEEADSRPAERIDPRLFIEETGKTGFTTLVDTAPREVLARLTAGDQVTLQREGGLLYVLNAAGQRIGRIEPRLANRLIKFLEAGNRYAAGITDLSESEVKLIIRETFQSPSMLGRVSFPTRGGGEVVRGYIKDTMLRRDLDDDEEVGEDGEYLDTDEEDGADEEDEDAAEPEFEEPEFNEQDR